MWSIHKTVMDADRCRHILTVPLLKTYVTLIFWPKIQKGSSPNYMINKCIKQSYMWSYSQETKSPAFSACLLSSCCFFKSPVFLVDTQLIYFVLLIGIAVAPLVFAFITNWRKKKEFGARFSFTAQSKQEGHAGPYILYCSPVLIRPRPGEWWPSF